LDGSLVERAMQPTRSWSPSGGGDADRATAAEMLWGDLAGLVARVTGAAGAATGSWSAGWAAAGR